jgi:hypothetical protein
VTWSYQLSAEQVDTYYTLEYFLKKDDVAWDPVPATIALSAPDDLTGESFNLTWTSVPGAIGYTIIRNDSTIGFSESTGFQDETADVTAENVYRIKSVSDKGNLSEASEAFIHNPLANDQIKESIDMPNFSIVDGLIILSANYNIKLYNLSGQLILHKKNVSQLSVLHLSAGTYLLVTENNIGGLFSRKISIN